jgi:hypothetical protein
MTKRPSERVGEDPPAWKTDPEWGNWIVWVVGMWDADPWLREQFEYNLTFLDWAYEVSEQLIRSAFLGTESSEE